LRLGRVDEEGGRWSCAKFEGMPGTVLSYQYGARSLLPHSGLKAVTEA